MRYDTPIYFQKIKHGSYDELTGNYAKDILHETCVFASVMDTGNETMKLVYGKLKQGSLTITLQNHYDHSFDKIRIGNKLYQVDLSRRLRVKQSYIVSEVQ